MQISFAEVISQLVVMIVIIAAGYLAKVLKILDSAGDKTLSGLVVNITSPALIILSMSAVLDGKALSNVLIVAVIAACMISFAYLISKLLSMLNVFTGDKGIIYRFALIFGNASFLGFPLCYGLFGKAGLLYASIYSAVQDTFFWSLGVSIMAGKGRSKSLKNLLNPNMIAIVIGFAFLLLGVQLPVFADKALSTVGNATIPIALMLVGSGFYRVELKPENFKDILLPGAVKLLVIPVIAGTMLFYLNIDMIVKYVLLLELSMPCAASGVFLAKNYDRDYKLASKLVMSITALSMLTIPLIVLAVRNFW